jgi:DNA-binding NtrC family response regulator
MTEKIERLLIVEDDGDVQRAARFALSPHVTTITFASSLDEAAQKMSAGPFDVVLLDMNFALGDHSGRDGLDGLGRIRAADPTLSVVLMTAYGAVSLAVDALKQGAFDFVLKPWKNDKLISTVLAAAEMTRNIRTSNSLDLDAIERTAIERALKHYEGNIAQAAGALGLSRPALYRRMAKHGL